MKPPVIRPSSLPALADCPCYCPDQSTGQEQKSEGTKRHTALGKYLAEDPTWPEGLTRFDAEGVQWAGEYIRTTAPLSDYPLEIERTGTAVLDDLTMIRGTPDVFCGPVLYDLKGRNVDEYREQMEAYALQSAFPQIEVHVLYATDRRAERFTVNRQEADARISQIVAAAEDPCRSPRVCDWCAWCSNRPTCPALAMTGKTAANNLGIPVPVGVIEEITDAEGLGKLKRAADAVAEWAKTAKEHAREMAVKHGVVAEGYRLTTRRGNPTITNTWAAIQASGLPIEAVANSLTISLPNLAEAYATHHHTNDKTARADLEAKLGALIERGSSISYLTSKT